MTQSVPLSPVDLRRVLGRFFDDEELRILCFDLGVDYDSLRGEGKAGKSRELVAFMERRGRLAELEAAVRHERPSLDTAYSHKRVQDLQESILATSWSPWSPTPTPEVEVTVRVFLCYARLDQPRVEELHNRLSDAGFKPWMDKRDILPGELWEDVVRKAIRRSDFFLACLSANSVNRRGQIQKEIREALDVWKEQLDSDIYLIPVRLEDCDVPESLSRFQWVNLFEDDGGTQLVKAIGAGMERRMQDTQLAVQESTQFESYPDFEKPPVQLEAYLNEFNLMHDQFEEWAEVHNVLQDLAIQFAPCHSLIFAFAPSGLEGSARAMQDQQDKIIYQVEIEWRSCRRCLHRLQQLATSIQAIGEPYDPESGPGSDWFLTLKRIADEVDRALFDGDAAALADRLSAFGDWVNQFLYVAGKALRDVVSKTKRLPRPGPTE